MGNKVTCVNFLELAKKRKDQWRKLGSGANATVYTFGVDEKSDKDVVDASSYVFKHFPNGGMMQDYNAYIKRVHETIQQTAAELSFGAIPYVDMCVDNDTKEEFGLMKRIIPSTDPPIVFGGSNKGDGTLNEVYERDATIRRMLSEFGYWMARMHFVHRMNIADIQMMLGTTSDDPTPKLYLFDLDGVSSARDKNTTFPNWYASAMIWFKRLERQMGKKPYEQVMRGYSRAVEAMSEPRDTPSLGIRADGRKQFHHMYNERKAAAALYCKTIDWYPSEMYDGVIHNYKAYVANFNGQPADFNLVLI